MTRLTNVCLETASFRKTLELFQAVCGLPPQFPLHTDSQRVPAGRFQFRDCELIVMQAESTRTGVTGITLAVPDLAARRQALAENGIPAAESVDRLQIQPDAASGIRVTLVGKVGASSLPAHGTARLDHLALRVRDLTSASQRWTAITGVRADPMGIHPVSGGAFTAARFLLGERMIELIAPVTGVPSAIAGRLASHGEGPAALALPVDDLERVLAKLRDLPARVLFRDPHWMVHPGDSGGILLQLTPRVEHH